MNNCKKISALKIILEMMILAFCFFGCDFSLLGNEGEVFVYSDPVTEITEDEIEEEKDIEIEKEWKQEVEEKIHVDEEIHIEDEIVIEEIKEEEYTEPKKLTLIVYMAADNDLESYGIANLKQMERANYKNMNVLVLFDRAEDYDETNGNWTDTRLYEVIHDDSSSNYIASRRLDCPMLGISALEETELDMGNFNTLRNLIDFAKTEYESEKYSLIFWGHGTGWRGADLDYESCRAVAIDDKSGTYMTVAEEAKALKNQGLSVIGFDTCFAGVLENIYELKFCSMYTVACPGVSPSIGWNYTKLLESLDHSDFTEKSIAIAMAESSAVKTSVFDNSKLQDLMRSFEAFSRKLAENITSAEIRNDMFVQLMNSKSYSYTQYPCDMYLDIYGLGELFAKSTEPSLIKLSEKLKQTVNASGFTTNSQNLLIGVHFIPKLSSKTVSVQHSVHYIKSESNESQCEFIKDSDWWVPTENGKSGSLLDKLFYTVF